ncbi:MAG: RNA polymerase sigma factor [Bdellovibrionales bacterium]|jgi:RNA polymerase sigma-70 factor, ECF subfamily|nr:RNA polymerase sigma factor [Bdellovibrionales bacterium]MBT3525864.1 RNA polymerase sigma factor [Bdellovibrionales bacterium]MBT7670113.1 RNA polymerase sigma factor [Bdellovibrionales bacterium]MBT7766600.1 RNA polymerase sigma factor [Bdellovibrionales bacterium]
MKLRECYETYHRDLISVLFHYCGNTQEAEEMVQDVFIKYFEQQEQLENHPNIKAWLMRAGINLCFDRKRHWKVVLRHLHFLKGMEHAQSDPVEIASTLQVALNKLDSRTKMAVILKYMEEYSYQEISQMMSLPEGSVKSMVSRGLSKIEG